MSVEKNIRIQNLYDDQSAWEAVNSKKPRRGEIVIYDDNGIQKIKIGDGKTPLKDLRYVADMYEVLYGYNSDEIFKYTSKTTTSIDQPNKYKCLLIEKDVTYINTGITNMFAHVESVQFEKGINLTNIPLNAFKDFVNITEITIPEGVTKIESCAFMNCSNLKRISIPTTVTDIDKDGDGAILKGCNSLEYIEVPFTGKEPYGYFEDTDKNEDGTPIDTNQGIFGHLFGCSKSEQQDKFVPSSLKTIKITNANHIHARTFEKCRHVENIEITLNEEKEEEKEEEYDIQPGLFRDCNSLKNIYVDDPFGNYTVVNNCIMRRTELIAGCNSSKIPDGTTTICYEAFRGAIHLLRAELPATVTTLESAVFKNCHSLNSVTQGGGPLTVSPSSECFLECRSLYSIKLDCARIGYNAFGYCSTLSSISISNACKTVDPYSFQYCTALTELTIPDSVYRIPTGDEVVGGVAPETEYCCIGTYAFNGCNALTHLTIPEIARFELAKNTAGKNILINYIPSSVLGQMFGGSYDRDKGIHPNDKVPASLKTVTLTKQKSLPADCFKNCYYIETVETSGNITSAGNNTFKDCRNLVRIPNINQLTTIPEGMFYGCEQLMSVTISYGVESIGESAFYNCSSLTSVTIPDSVTSIGTSAFYYCTGLTSISLPFVGATQDGTSYTYFGYIFGASSYLDNNSYVPTSLKTVVITGNTLRSYAFWGCKSIVTIKGELNHISIGNNCFENCTNLQNVVFSKFTYVGEYAFKDCSSINYIELRSGGNEKLKIDRSAFENCTNLKTIKITGAPRTKDNYVEFMKDSLKNVAPDMCLDLSEIVYADQLQHISLCDQQDTSNKWWSTGFPDDGVIIFPKSVKDNNGTLKNIKFSDFVFNIKSMSGEPHDIDNLLHRISRFYYDHKFMAKNNTKILLDIKNVNQALEGDNCLGVCVPKWYGFIITNYLADIEQESWYITKKQAIKGYQEAYSEIFLESPLPHSSISTSKNKHLTQYHSVKERTLYRIDCGDGQGEADVLHFRQISFKEKSVSPYDFERKPEYLDKNITYYYQLDTSTIN